MASCLMAESSYPSQQQDKFVLRLPDGMRDRIKAAAEANNRSMNAEIVATLEEKYPAPKKSPMDPISWMWAILKAPEDKQDAMLSRANQALEGSGVTLRLSDPDGNPKGRIIFNDSGEVIGIRPTVKD